MLPVWLGDGPRVVVSMVDAGGRGCTQESVGAVRAMVLQWEGEWEIICEWGRSI